MANSLAAINTAFPGRRPPPHFAPLGKGLRRRRIRGHLGLQHRTLGQIDAIGVDEIQYAKGPKYLTLVYQIDLGLTRLLWVGKERTIESFQGFFTVMGQEIVSQIAFAVLRHVGTLSEGYPRKMLPGADSGRWR
jgi:hypothetical protein